MFFLATVLQRWIKNIFKILLQIEKIDLTLCHIDAMKIVTFDLAKETITEEDNKVFVLQIENNKMKSQKKAF